MGLLSLKDLTDIDNSINTPRNRETCNRFMDRYSVFMLPVCVLIILLYCIFLKIEL